MSTNFVDVRYRGLPLLAKVALRGEGGVASLAMPQPMPVGTALELAWDGEIVEVIVRAVREQIADGGEGRPPPGNDVVARAPTAAWRALVGDAPPELTTSRRTREISVAEVVQAAAAAAHTERAAAVEPGADVRRRTRELTSQEVAAAAQAADTLAQPIRVAHAPVDGAERRLVDDGRPTTVMTAVEAPAEEVGATTVMAAVEAPPDEGATQVMAAVEPPADAGDSAAELPRSEGDDASASASMPAAGAKKKKKKR